jgi:glycosyltransferase involved in cell wall biosynthesis
MNVIFTNINEYANVHEAFRLQMLNGLASTYGWQVFVNVLDNNKYPDYSNITYSSNNTIRQDFKEFCDKYKPKKICNFIDYLTRWDIVEYDCEHIYFVRSCYAEVLKRTGQTANNEWLRREQTYINAADKVIVACPESHRAVLEHYSIDAEIVLEYVNPEKYLKMPPVSLNKKAYYVGRFDKQKRFDLIHPVDDWTVVGIGKNELDDIDYSHIQGYGVMPFEQYAQYISDATFGLYPAVWESNGYGVQECLAMGKIPIIQVGSGGHERLCNSTNSISIEYTEDKWYEKAMDLYDPNMHEAAKSTLTQEMYDKSLEKFVNVLC